MIFCIQLSQISSVIFVDGFFMSFFLLQQTYSTWYLCYSFAFSQRHPFPVSFFFSMVIVTSIINDVAWFINTFTSLHLEDRCLNDVTLHTPIDNTWLLNNLECLRHQHKKNTSSSCYLVIRDWCHFCYGKNIRIDGIDWNLLYGVLCHILFI